MVVDDGKKTNGWPTEGSGTAIQIVDLEDARNKVLVLAEGVRVRRNTPIPFSPCVLKEIRLAHLKP